MSADDNRQQQEDELCVLQSIYGDEAITTVDAASYNFAIPEAAAQPHLVLAVHLPDSYPSEHPPVFELSDSCDCLSGDVLSGLASELEVMFAPGEVVLWHWIEHLRERWPSLAPCKAAEDAAAADAGLTLAAELQAAELQAAELLEAGEGGDQQQQQGGQQCGMSERDGELKAAIAEVMEMVVHGEPFTEKRSTFQAHLAPARSFWHVEALVELLLQNNKIRAATHNIMAYRIEQPERGTFLQDCDDDGEQAAGRRLLHLLQITDARNVCVVVSRWYGGILLGPARFTHINNAARELLDACGYVAVKESKGGGGMGKKW